MMTALATGSVSVFQQRKRMSSRTGTTTGRFGVVGAHRDLALERLAVGAPEVAQRVRADAAHADVAVALR